MKIKFLKKTFERMKSALKWDGKEKSCFLLCNRSLSNDNASLIADKIISPDEADYMERSAASCEINKPFIDMVYREAVKVQSDVIKVHIHPPGYPAIFSPIDEACEPEFMRHIHSKIDGIVQVGLVFNSSFDACDGWYYDPLTDYLFPIKKIVIVGKDNFELLIPYRSPLNDKALDPALDRTVIAFGEGRVKKMGCLDIGVIGASGLGSPIIEMLSRDRPRSMLICDPDKIEASNLNRLVAATERDIGRNKAEFYAQYVSLISPDTKITPCPFTFHETSVQKEFTQADIIFGCVDSGARIAINQLSSAHAIPYFDLGASILSENENPSFMGGQIYSNIPGRDVCISCTGVFDDLLSEYLSPMAREANEQQGYVKGADIKSPLVTHLDFIIAGYGYNEALKYMLGLPGESSFKVYFDLLNDKIVRSNCQTKNCLVCHENGYLGKGDKVPFLYPQEDAEDSAILSILKEREKSECAKENEAEPETIEKTSDEKE